MAQIKLSVCAVIAYKERFLIVKRSQTDDFLPGCWEFPGGGVERSETIIDALKRELKEEIGLDITGAHPRLMGVSEEFMDEDKTERYLQLNYKINLEKEPQISLSQEHVAFDWADAQDDRLDAFLLDIVKQLG
ncbi:MAG: NUDIX domain-containing protein [Alphaproteobacteria bacterium]|nr:NUDIX domain-containing protein [Alphaproteobacteria bacterium]